MDRQLDVVGLAEVERGLDLRRAGGHVLVDLQARPAGAQRRLDGRRVDRRPADQQRGVQRHRLERGPGRRQPLRGVAAEVPHRPEVLDDERRDAGGEGGIGHLGREPVHVRIDRAGRDDHPGGVEHRRRGPEHDVDAVHRVRVAGAADRHDAPVGDPEARAAHAKDRVGDEPADDRELHAAAPGPHAEAVAQRAAETRQDLIGPADAVVLGHELQGRVAEADGESGTAVAPLARQPSAASRAPGASSGPSTSPPCPRITRAPPNGRRRTVTGWPGSKKTFTPAGTSSRMPHAAARSKRSARLASKTWKCEVSPTTTSPSLTTSMATVLWPHGTSSSVAAAAARTARSGPRARQPRAVAETAPRPRRAEAAADVVEHILGTERRVAASDRGRIGDPVAGRLAHLVGDERRRLGLPEPQPARAPAPRELGGEEDLEAVRLAGQQAHRRQSATPARPRCYSTTSACSACASSASIGTTSSARACVAARTTRGAQPAS